MLSYGSEHKFEQGQEGLKKEAAIKAIMQWIANSEYGSWKKADLKYLYNLDPKAKISAAKSAKLLYGKIPSFLLDDHQIIEEYLRQIKEAIAAAGADKQEKSRPSYLNL